MLYLTLLNDAQVLNTALTAAVAAVAALIVAVIGAVNSRRNEARSAHRVVLGPLLEDLGRHIAGVLATSAVFLKRAEVGQDLKPWRDRMEGHAEALKDLRARARYPLYGMAEGLMVLSRVASWVQHYHSRVPLGGELLASADKLRMRIDRVIAKSYRRGEPPTWYDRRCVRRLASTVEELWNKRMETPPSD